MLVKRLSILVISISLLLGALPGHADIIKIGVLSKQDFQATLNDWQTITSQLHKAQPDHSFQLLPYHLQSDVAVDLDKGKLDFLVANKRQLQQLSVENELVSILKVRRGKSSASEMLLARTATASYPVTYQVTHTLLQASKSSSNDSALSMKWQLAESKQEVLSLKLQLSKLLNSGTIVATELYKSHGDLILAGIVTLLLLIASRGWFSYHHRQQVIKERKQQSTTTPQHVDTVY